VFVSVTALVALVIAYGVFGNPLDPFNWKSFSPAAWQTGTPETRARMAKSLIRHHLKRGMSAADVVALIGPPDDQLTGRIDAGGHSLPGVRTYAYDLGNWSLLGMDAAYLYVHLDAADRVISAEVAGY